MRAELRVSGRRAAVEAGAEVVRDLLLWVAGKVLGLQGPGHPLVGSQKAQILWLGLKLPS